MRWKTVMWVSLGSAAAVALATTLNAAISADHPIHVYDTLRQAGATQLTAFAVGRISSILLVWLPLMGGALCALNGGLLLLRWRQGKPRSTNTQMTGVSEDETQSGATDGVVPTERRSEHSVYENRPVKVVVACPQCAAENQIRFLGSGEEGRCRECQMPFVVP